MKVDDCINGVMARFKNPNLAYYEEVHQHLAPLARELERSNEILHKRVAELEQDRARLDWVQLHVDSALTRHQIDIAMNEMDKQTKKIGV